MFRQVAARCCVVRQLWKVSFSCGLMVRCKVRNCLFGLSRSGTELHVALSLAVVRYVMAVMESSGQ